MVIFDTKPHKKIAHLKIKQTQHAILIDVQKTKNPQAANKPCFTLAQCKRLEYAQNAIFKYYDLKQLRCLISKNNNLDIIYWWDGFKHSNQLRYFCKTQHCKFLFAFISTFCLFELAQAFHLRPWFVLELLVLAGASKNATYYCASSYSNSCPKLTQYNFLKCTIRWIAKFNMA